MASSIAELELPSAPGLGSRAVPRVRTGSTAGCDVSRGFIAAYTLTEIAVFATYTPVLAILLPLKVQALGAAGKAGTLSLILLIGAVTAGLANIAAGALSDRTTGRFGRRRPWLIAGAAGMAAAILLMQAAAGLMALIGAVILLQASLNLVVAPMTAILADRVPDSQKGMVAGWLSLGAPLGTALGAALAGAVFAGGFCTGGVFTSGGAPYAVLAAVIACAVPGFALALNDPPCALRTPGPARADMAQAGMARAAVPLWRSRNFVLLWGTRFCMQCALATSAAYLLFYLEDVLGPRSPMAIGEGASGGGASGAWAGGGVAGGVAMLTTLSMLTGLAAGPACGAVAHSVAVQRRLLLGGALAITCAMGVFAAGLGWLPAVLAACLLGAGSGCTRAIDTALAARVIPSVQHAARDLGVLNLAHTVPQMVMPILALAVFSHGAATRGCYAILFAAAAVTAAAGGVLAQFIRQPPRASAGRAA
jgi:MFS family permease